MVELKRYDAIGEIIKTLDRNTFVICNLGVPSKELFNLQDREENFYMLGSMGLVSSVGLGLAIAKENKKIIAIDGDGSILMNMGSLSTISHVKPLNYTLIVIDNGVYGSTGNQKTHTHFNTRLDKIAEGAGFKSITVIKEKKDILSCLNGLGKGSHFILIRVEAGNKKFTPIPIHPVEIKNRFMKSLIK